MALILLSCLLFHLESLVHGFFFFPRDVFNSGGFLKACVLSYLLSCGGSHGELLDMLWVYSFPLPARSPVGTPRWWECIPFQSHPSSRCGFTNKGLLTDAFLICCACRGPQIPSFISWWLLLVHQAQPIELLSLIVTILSCPSKVTELWRFNTTMYATELSSGQMQCEDWQRAIHEKFQYASLAEQSHMATLVTRFLARETPHEYCTPTAVF